MMASSKHRHAILREGPSEPKIARDQRSSSSSSSSLRNQHHRCVYSQSVNVPYENYLGAVLNRKYRITGQWTNKEHLIFYAVISLEGEPFEAQAFDLCRLPDKLYLSRKRRLRRLKQSGTCTDDFQQGHSRYLISPVAAPLQQQQQPKQKMQRKQQQQQQRQGNKRPAPGRKPSSRIPSSHQGPSPCLPQHTPLTLPGPKTYAEAATFMLPAAAAAKKSPHHHNGGSRNPGPASLSASRKGAQQRQRRQRRREERRAKAAFLNGDQSDGG